MRRAFFDQSHVVEADDVSLQLPLLSKHEKTEAVPALCETILDTCDSMRFNPTCDCVGGCTQRMFKCLNSRAVARCNSGAIARCDPGGVVGVILRDHAFGS